MENIIEPRKNMFFQIEALAGALASLEGAEFENLNLEYKYEYREQAKNLYEKGYRNIQMPY